MIPAYNKLYLENTRKNLGRLFDYVTYDLKIDLSDFISMFLKTKISKSIEKGIIKYCVGMSGIELSYHILDEVNYKYQKVKPTFMINKSIEYWCGWALAYFQWESSISFKEMFTYISIDEIKKMYNPYHEMDIRHFCEHMKILYVNRKNETNLKIKRKKVGLTQKQLSELTNIPLRTIQQYEQRQKNINKAQADTLYALSKVLCCEMEELFEIYL